MFTLLKRVSQRLSLPQTTLSVQQMAREWLDDAAPRLRPGWHAECHRLLHREILPAIGDYRADQVTRRHVAAVVERCRDRPGIARNVYAILSMVWRWGLATGRVEDDPTRGIRRARARPRERVLSAREIGAIWAGAGNGHYAAIIRLLILAAARRDEIGELQWAEVRLDGEPTLYLPGTRTKNHRACTIPLAPEAVALLPARRAGPFVFGQRLERPFSGWSKCKVGLDARCGTGAFTICAAAW